MADWKYFLCDDAKKENKKEFSSVDLLRNKRFCGYIIVPFIDAFLFMIFWGELESCQLSSEAVIPLHFLALLYNNF